MSETVGDDDAIFNCSLGECLASSPAMPAGSSFAPIASLEHYTETERRRVFDALDILDNSAQITNRQFQHKREDGRVSLRTVASICLPDPNNPIVNLKSGRLIRVLTRDVSSRGVSFVCPDELPCEKIMVGLHVNERDTKWFYSDVVRAREIADTGFWEHAVVFRQAMTS
jgi:hypothetical protein